MEVGPGPAVAVRGEPATNGGSLVQRLRFGGSAFGYRRMGGDVPGSRGDGAPDRAKAAMRTFSAGHADGAEGANSAYGAAVTNHL